MLNERMPLMEHIGELRKRVIRVLAVFAVTMAAGFFTASPVVNYLKSSPPASEITWNAFSPWDGIRLYMHFAFLLAAGLTIPFLLYQLWCFVRPGLSASERKATLRYIPLSILLFGVGLIFAYLVIFKLAFRFAAEVNHTMELTETYGITQYFSFMSNILLPVSLMFELPVLVVFLTKIHILNPGILRKFRRHAYLVLVIVSTFIAPPDLISNVLIAIPLILLYEMSVYLSSRIERGAKLNVTSPAAGHWR